jgi:excisionase family DNA binding protein
MKRTANRECSTLGALSHGLLQSSAPPRPLAETRPLGGEAWNVRDPRVAYSVAEVTRLTGAGRTSIFEAIRTGQLTAVKFGRRTLIRRTDLESFMQELPPAPTRDKGGAAASVADRDTNDVSKDASSTTSQILSRQKNPGLA